MPLIYVSTPDHVVEQTVEATGVTLDRVVQAAQRVSNRYEDASYEGCINLGDRPEVFVECSAEHVEPVSAALKTTLGAKAATPDYSGFEGHADIG